MNIELSAQYAHSQLYRAPVSKHIYIHIHTPYTPYTDIHTPVHFNIQTYIETYIDHTVELLELQVLCSHDNSLKN